MNVTLRTELKTEYILKVSYFLNVIIWDKLTQHPRSVFP